MLLLAQRRLAEGDPFRARATIAWLLEGASRRNPLGFEPEHLAQLRAALAEAESAVARRGEQLRRELDNPGAAR
jgi:hypothetical protein